MSQKIPFRRIQMTTKKDTIEEKENKNILYPCKAEDYLSGMLCRAEERGYEKAQTDLKKKVEMFKEKIKKVDNAKIGRTDSYVISIGRMIKIIDEIFGGEK